MARYKPQPDPRGGHARIYWEILDSPAWRALTHADVRVYLAIRRRLGKTNNGNISATLTDCAHHGIKSSSTLAAALYRLEALGFISKTRQGGIAAGGKVCSLYRFTDEPTFDIPKVHVKAEPASNDWKAFTSLAHARSALRTVPSKNTSKVRPSKHSASTIEADAGFCASTIEHESGTVLRPSKRTKLTQSVPQAA